MGKTVKKSDKMPMKGKPMPMHDKKMGKGMGGKKKGC
jgi:hypothetical protein